MANNYWQIRQAKIAALTKSEAELNAALQKYYAKESEKLSREIASYYGEYGVNDVIEYRKLLLSLSDAEKQLLFENYDAFANKYPEYADLLPVRESIYKLNRAEGLKTSILLQQLEIGAIEISQMQEHFEKMAALFVENSANFLVIDKNIAKFAIGQAWFEETDFSERIWSNRQALAKTLQNDVVNGIIRGEDYKRISRNIQEKFKRVSKRDIERLVFTEDTYLANEAAMQAYVNDPDFSEYEYMIADGRACDVCASLDGQRFRIDERVPGVNFPPMHPWCRCTFVPVYSGSDVEKANYFQKSGLTSEDVGGIIKSLDVDDFYLAAYGKNIQQEVSEAIISTMSKLEKDGDFYISEIRVDDYGSSASGTTALQIEPLSNGTLQLNINTRVFSDASLSEINERFSSSKKILANNLEEALVHESGHAKTISRKKISEIQSMYKELSEIHIDGVSAYAKADGAECIAETEILLYRGETVPDDALNLYEKYVRGGK